MEPPSLAKELRKLLIWLTLAYHALIVKFSIENRFIDKVEQGVSFKNELIIGVVLIKVGVVVINIVVTELPFQDKISATESSVFPQYKGASFMNLSIWVHHGLRVKFS